MLESALIFVLFSLAYFTNRNSCIVSLKRKFECFFLRNEIIGCEGEGL